MDKNVVRRFPRRTFLGVEMPGRVSAKSALSMQNSANVPTPREQTVIVEAHETSVYDSFNPFIPNGEAYMYGINQIARECMFYANFMTGEIVSWLGESWSYNADFTELTLKLNPNAAWNDGQPYTSADVLFTFDMLRANEGLTGSATVTGNIESATAPDAQTVVMTLTGPKPRFHYTFIAGIVFDGLRVVPKHVWEGQDPNTFQNNPPVYTGPYVLDQIVAEQFMYVWKKNPTYWNAANFNPAPEYVVFRQFLPSDAAMQEFQRGNIDVANNDSIGYLNQQALISQYDKAAVMTFADPCPRAFFPNFESPSGLFKTAEGRRAISYLIDRELIGNVIWQPPSRPTKYPWADYEGNERWSNPEIQAEYDMVYDPAKAEELLAAAGAVKDGDTWTLNGEPIQLNVVVPGGTTVQEYQIAQTLADSAAEIGVEIVLTGLSFPAWNDALSLGEFDISCHWLCGLTFDPAQLYDNFLSENASPIGSPSTAGNEGRMQIPELDDIVATLSTLSPDDETNKATFDQGLEIFLKNMPAITSVQTTFPSTCGTAFWTGWPTDEDPYNVPLYWWAQFLFVIGNLQPVAQ
jgi:peptide/nickel transport system substrate-binding protein